MGKRSLKGIRKIKILMLLMLITLVLIITSTYAWFSTQRDVEITGMRLNVEVAESMQISLDGETWTQSIVIKDMKQFYGTYTGTGDSVAIYQAKKPDEGGNQNYVPKELLPVSSSGTVTNGKLQFVQGKVYTGSNGKTGLKEITSCSEADLTPTATVGTREGNNSVHPFLVFDMYLRNISAKEEGELDILKLNKGSRVWVDTTVAEYEGAGKADTGLEYSARVAFIPYNNTLSVTAMDTEAKTVGEQVRELTADTNEKVAIWEPNDLEHTPYVVANNSMGITQTSQSVNTFAIKNSLGGTTADIDDVYDLADTTNLASPITMKPAYNLSSGTTVAAELTAIDGTTKLGLKPNTISKVRCYIWLEGQDPDCIDMASTGDKLNASIKLTKDKTDGTGEVTYDKAGNASEITAADYGGIVENYADTSSNAQKSVNWRIFHSDGTNVYLIADDYVERQYVPAGRNGKAVNPNEGSYARGFGMADIVNDTTSETKYVGSADWDSTIKSNLLSQYTYTSTNNNAKATAYLLDTNAWLGFANSNYAEYAIGGPTLELFTASYNKTHTSKTIETQVASATGYKVKWSTDADYGYAISGLNTSESLYVISGTTNALGMWIASPSADDANYVVLVKGTGSVTYDYYYAYYSVHGLGARPIVALKSNIQIEKIEEGRYQIVE